MLDYDSFHFSPFIDRTILMPVHDKREKSTPRPTFFGGLRRSPFSTDGVDPDNPYKPVQKGFFPVETEIGGHRKRYAVYVPGTMKSKGFGLLFFLPSGKTAEQALDEGWRDIAERRGIALMLMENHWDRCDLTGAFDYAQHVLEHQFQKREITDIAEATIYPYGEDDAAGIAAAYALVYSATFPAFGADGDCGVDPALLKKLENLPSDGIDGLPKTAVPLPGAIVDRAGNAGPVARYIKKTLCAGEENLTNDIARVYIQRAYRGQHFVNEQPVGRFWYADASTLNGADRQTVRDRIVGFLMGFSRWGGYGNAHLRRSRTGEDIGVRRVWKTIGGYRRYWDVYAPSWYNPGEDRTYPLVVMIHGFSCSTDYVEQTSDWDRLAEERGFIVVYASAYPQKGMGAFPLPTWDTGNNGGVDDIPYFNALLDSTIAEYNIDTERIYAVGHSNGGMMTYLLMDRMPRRFAAFSPTGCLLSMVQQPDFLSHGVVCPAYAIVGEFDIFGGKVTSPEDGTWQTIEKLCQVSNASFNNDNWYDNGRYHTLVLYDALHRPVVRYTVMNGCPHVYTPGMSERTWDDFLCHFSRRPDGTIEYRG